MFDWLATRLCKEVDCNDTTTERVRRLVADRIGRDRIGMRDIGAQLHMSDATLRRRLHEEGTTYKVVVDELRRGLAEQYLGEPRIAIGKISRLLGFSTQSAFGRAFRRWNGTSAIEHRLRINAERRMLSCSVGERDGSLANAPAKAPR